MPTAGGHKVGGHKVSGHKVGGHKVRLPQLTNMFLQNMYHVYKHTHLECIEHLYHNLNDFQKVLKIMILLKMWEFFPSAMFPSATKFTNFQERAAVSFLT